MRLGRKFVKNKMYDITSSRIESRDAIIWEILPAQRICRCKIQGSSNLITAWYPDNWEATPVWLKTGNAVIIRHTAGNRSRVEVVGHGQLVPTPQTGDSSAPALDVAEDAVLSGMYLSAGANGTTPGMLVIVGIGTYRINGTIYTLEAISMDEATLLDMNLEVLIGTVADVVQVDTESIGYARYDNIVIGADGIVDVIKGTHVVETSVPEIPSVPAAHVSLGYVLILGGVTDIYPQYINASFSAIKPTTLTVDITDDILDWAETSTTITIKVFDQYNRPVTTTGNGWTIRTEFEIGNGTIPSTGYTGSGSNDVVFTYTRDGEDPGDVSPVIKFYYNDTVFVFGAITLLDINGDVMI